MGDTVKIELKTLMIDHQGKEMRDIGAIDPKEITKIIEDNKGKSMQEITDILYEIAKPLYIGTALKNILASFNAFSNNEEAAIAYVWITNIRNQIIKDKGELEVTKQDVKKILEILDRPPKVSPNEDPNMRNPTATGSGQVYGYLKKLIE